jgi:hypothetical protein
LARSLRSTWAHTKTHQAVHPTNQLQSRALWPPADFVYIKTLLAEWAYSMAFQTSAERNHWLPRYLAIYNSRRFHMALARRSRIQQLRQLRATE